MNIKTAVKIFGTMCADHAPEILAGVGIAGMITTVVLAVRKTPKVVDELREKEPETTMEEIKIMAKHYILPVVTGTLSAVCMIGSVSVSNRRNAALAAALTLTEDNFIEYKDKVKEMIGEKKEEKIEEAIAEDYAKRIDIYDKHVPHTGTGQTLCIDSITGQAMWSDVDYIKSKFIKLREYLEEHETMNISDYCDILGLNDPQIIGYLLGWRYKYRPTSTGWEYDKNARIELFGTSTLINDTPVFVIGHRLPPAYGYDG